MQKIKKILRAVSEKTALTTHQLLPTTPNLKDLADAGQKSNHIFTFPCFIFIKVPFISQFDSFNKLLFSFSLTYYGC